MGFWTRLTFCLSIAIVSVNCETFTECAGVASATFIGSSSGCAYYIYCDGEDSFEGSCPDSMMFNNVDSICDDEINVECSIGPSTTSISPPSTTVTATPPQITTLPVGISTTTTNAPLTALSSISTSTSTSTLTSTSTAVTDSDEDVVCPQPSNQSEIIYLPSTKSCSQYYMCYRSVAMPMTCPDNLHYNSLTTNCDWPSITNCQIAGSTTVSPKELCTSQSFGYLAYPSNCHYYYRCTNGFLTVQECPIGFGWDANRKMCSTTGC